MFHKNKEWEQALQSIQEMSQDMEQVIHAQKHIEEAQEYLETRLNKLDAATEDSDDVAERNRTPVEPVDLNVISKDTFEAAANQVFNAYSDTLAKSFGPYGATTIIYRHPFSHVTKDGYTIATSLSTNVANTYTNQAIANMMTDICGRMNTAVGDGTTTAIVSTNSIYRSYLEKRDWFERNGVMSRNILSTFEKAKQKIHQQLEKHSKPIHIDKPVTDEEDMLSYIRDVVNISDNGDDTITDTLVDLYKEFGLPCITCEKSVDGEERVEVVNGYRAPLFITDDMYINSDDKTMQLEEADVIVFTCKVTENIFETLVQPTLMISKNLGHHLVMVCPSVDEVLLDRVIAPMLNAEYKKNHDTSLVICCYKAANSYQRKSIEDFAMLCHTSPISRATATAMIQAVSPKVQMPGQPAIENALPDYSIFELLNFYRVWAPSMYAQIRVNGDRIQLIPMSHSVDLETERANAIKLKTDMQIVVPGLPVREGEGGEFEIKEEPLILDIGYCKNLELGKKTSIIREFFYDKKMYDLHFREAKDNLEEVENKFKKLGTFNTEITKAQERLFSLGLKLAHIEVGGDSELAIGMRKDVYDDAVKAAASAYKYGIINGCNVSTIISIEEILEANKDEDKTPDSIMDQILLLIQDGFIYTYKTVLKNWIPEEKVLLKPYSYEELEDSMIDVYENIESLLTQYCKVSLHRLMGCSKQDSYIIFHDVYHKMIERKLRRETMFKNAHQLMLPTPNFSLFDFLVEFSIQHDVVFDVVNKSFSHKIINSFQTDDEILTATVDLMSLMISGNQMIVTQRNSF